MCIFIWNIPFKAYSRVVMASPANDYFLHGMVNWFIFFGLL